jgi:hypothetical protein
MNHLIELGRRAAETHEFISREEANEMRRNATDVYSGDDPRLAVTRKPLHRRKPGDKNRYMDRNDRLAYHKKLALGQKGRGKRYRAKQTRLVGAGALGGLLVGGLVGARRKNGRDE